MESMSTTFANRSCNVFSLYGAAWSDSWGNAPGRILTKLTWCSANTLELPSCGSRPFSIHTNPCSTDFMLYKLLCLWKHWGYTSHLSTMRKPSNSYNCAVMQLKDGSLLAHVAEVGATNYWDGSGALLDTFVAKTLSLPNLPASCSDILAPLTPLDWAALAHGILCQRSCEAFGTILDSTAISCKQLKTVKAGHTYANPLSNISIIHTLHTRSTSHTAPGKNLHFFCDLTWHGCVQFLLPSPAGPSTLPGLMKLMEYFRGNTLSHLRPVRISTLLVWIPSSTIWPCCIAPSSYNWSCTKAPTMTSSMPTARRRK